MFMPLNGCLIRHAVPQGRMQSADLSDMRKRSRTFTAPARRFTADEHGFAVPTVMLLLLAVMAIVSVGVMASIQAQSGGVRDEQTKSAFAVAESGAEQAVLAVNRERPPCTAVDGSWCVADGTLNGATFQTWVRRSVPAQGSDPTLDVVSQGTTNGVTRRVHVTALAVVHPFADYSVRAQDQVQVDANSQVDANTSSNGNIELGTNSKLCGNASVGDTGTMDPPPPNGAYLDPGSGCTQPTSTVDHQDLPLPPVDQGNAPEINDNGRLFAQDPVSGNRATACWNGLNADGRAGTCRSRELVIGTNSGVTLTGYTYSFCSLVLNSNSSLSMAAGRAVTIYFDSPEACGYTPQVVLESKSRIAAASGTGSSLALLFVGPSTVLLRSNTAVDGPCDQNLVIYGPETDVTLNSGIAQNNENTRFCGAIGAKNIHLNSNSRVSSGTNAAAFTLRTSTYTVSRFVECTAAGAVSPSDPSAGC